ncbi:MAG: hypothetical protein Q7S74_03180 [Nanoarchaeota archaeon]|nr:hypothetical protein [Nanoarchaeota archaeon]
MSEEEIKKGLNIYLYYWTIPVFLAFVIINYSLRNFKIEALNLGLMISVVSFLFGFLITITFSMLLNRSSSLKEDLAIEAGRLVSLYFLSKQLGQKFHEKIIEKIDEYAICTLRDYTNYEISRDPMYSMYLNTPLMEIKDKSQEAAANSFYYVLGEFEPLREKLEYLTNRRVEWSIKIADYLLGIILIILLFLNRGDSFTNAIFVVLSTIIIFIFLIIEDFDDLRIGDYTYNISNSEQIFDLIGKERYYPEEVVDRVELTPNRTYRIGIQDKITKKEKIFQIQYNPKFNSRLRFLTKKVKKDAL